MPRPSNVMGRRRFERGDVLAREVEFDHVILRMLGMNIRVGRPAWRSDRNLAPGRRWRFRGFDWFSPSRSDAFCILERVCALPVRKRRERYRHFASAAFSISAGDFVRVDDEEAWLPATSVVWAFILAANILWASGAITLSFVVIT